MKITITGSLGNISKPLAKKLIAEGHQVTVITSKDERKAEIEALGAIPAAGSINDAEFLKSVFTGADAVYTMVPPNFGGSNVVANTAAAGRVLYTAIKESGVKRVVQLSSTGAHLAEGNGPIAGIHSVEQELSKLDDSVSVTFLRAGYFYINFYNNIPLIKNTGIIGSNWPASAQLPLVHPEDIARAAAEELVKTQRGKNIRYIVSDVVTAEKLAAELGAAIGKPDLNWVEFTDEQLQQALEQAGLPAEIAGLYVEMGTGFRNGNIPADFIRSGGEATGHIKIKDFAQDFARLYHN